MLSKITSRTLAGFVLITILVFGFFSIKVKVFFSTFIEKWLEMFGFDSSLIVEKLNDFAQSGTDVPGILGWFIYYPTYFLLHIAFIWLLFSKQKTIRNYLMLGLAGLIFLLILLIVTGKVLDFNTVYTISYDAFQKLFGLPFILLFIEGGRILYKDVFGTENLR